MKYIVTLCQLALCSLLLFAAVSAAPRSLEPQAPAGEREKRIQEYGPEDLFPGMKERKKAVAEPATEPKKDKQAPQADASIASQKPAAAPATARVMAPPPLPISSPTPKPSPAQTALTESIVGARVDSSKTPPAAPSSMVAALPNMAPKHKTSRWMLVLFLFGIVLSGGMLLFLVAKLKEQIGETQFQAQTATRSIEPSPALAGEQHIRLSDKSLKAAKKMRRATNA
jgi:hypothetical protein